jgi:hypothetical protein
MMDRLISASMALSLGFLVWLYARGREQETVDNVPIPVQLALAPGQEDQYDLQINGSPQVLVSFSGPPSCIHELRGMLQRGEMKVDITVSVPEERQTESRVLDTVQVDAADVHAPPGVTAVVLEGRNRIPVTLNRLVERRMPVRFESTRADEIGQATIDPGLVLVRGPQEILDRIRTIPTALVSLPPDADLIPGENSLPAVALIHELEGRAIRVTPDHVAVRYTIRARQKLYRLEDVPIHFLCPANFPLRPHFGDDRDGKVSLRIIGPAVETQPAVVAYIDLTAGEAKQPGFYADEPIKLQLPTDFRLDQDPPRSRQFQLVPTEAPAHAPGNHGP